MFRRLASIVVVSIAVCSLPVLWAEPVAAATFPTGFTDTKVAGDLGSATSVAQLPDGRFLVTSQDGRLFVVQNGAGAVALNLATLSKVCSASEMGLLGVTVDPQFSTNGHIYLFYTARIGDCSLVGADPGGAKNRVSRFTLAGATVNPATEVILLDNMPEWGGNHNGGDVRVAKDGTLFVSVGDGGGGAPSFNPADYSLPNGKILRINLDGSIPADNPRPGTVCKNSWGPPGTAKVCGEIWADGLRNPFRLGFDISDPGVKFRINDVGQGVWEEVNDAVKDAHYGWPCREGPNPFSGSATCKTPLESPKLWYSHDTGCNVITGGAFVPPGTWQGYDGAYLFVDFGCGRMWAAQPNEGGVPQQVLATGMGLTTDLEFFPTDGGHALFYTTYAGGGQLRKVVGPSPTPPPNTVPNLKFTAVQPARVLDTRAPGIGVAPGKLVAREAITVKVTGGVVPADAKAVALNVTATNADGAGFVTAWATGRAMPSTSSLNLSFFDETAANAVVVPVGQGGQVNLFTLGGVHLVADVTGYFTDAGATTDGRFQTAPSPTRLLDTRNGTGGKLGPFVGQDQFDLVVTGATGVPVDATAVAITVTYTNVAETGFLTVWPTGQTRPVASTTNPNAPGDIRSNLALVSVGTGGMVSIYSHRRTDVVVDVVGWFKEGSGTQGLFTAVSPQRVADSRQVGAPFGRIQSRSTVTMDFTGLAPGPAAAVLYNLTATNTVAGGFITAHPASTPLPTASSVNWSGAGQSQAALTISSLAASNDVSLYGFTPVDAVIDVSGWFE